MAKQGNYHETFSVVVLRGKLDTASFQVVQQSADFPLACSVVAPEIRGMRRMQSGQRGPDCKSSSWRIRVTMMIHVGLTTRTSTEFPYSIPAVDSWLWQWSQRMVSCVTLDGS